MLQAFMFVMVREKKLNPDQDTSKVYYLIILKD